MRLRQFRGTETLSRCRHGPFRSDFASPSAHCVKAATMDGFSAGAAQLHARRSPEICPTKSQRAAGPSVALITRPRGCQTSVEAPGSTTLSACFVARVGNGFPFQPAHSTRTAMAGSFAAEAVRIRPIASLAICLIVSAWPGRRDPPLPAAEHRLDHQASPLAEF